jgi:hypothetical protein
MAQTQGTPANLLPLSELLDQMEWYGQHVDRFNAMRGTISQAQRTSRATAGDKPGASMQTQTRRRSTGTRAKSGATRQRRQRSGTQAAGQGTQAAAQ